MSSASRQDASPTEASYYRVLVIRPIIYTSIKEGYCAFISIMLVLIIVLKRVIDPKNLVFNLS